MKIDRWSGYLTMLLATAMAVPGRASAAPPARSVPSTEQVLAGAAQQNAFTFLVFYRHDNQATQSMLHVVRNEVGNRNGQAVMAAVSLTNPANRTVIERFDVARAPMPLTLAVAPNGAITGVFPHRVSADKLSGCFVTPAQAECMKAIQTERIVLVSVDASIDAPLPPAATDLQTDSQFAGRLTVIPVYAQERAEGAFLDSLGIDPSSAQVPAIVVLAPPGVVVGRFSANASGEEIAAALHKAGKCCDDPNCKHNRSAEQRRPAARNR